MREQVILLDSTKVRVSDRVLFEEDFVISAKTFGTPNIYKLNINNASLSGFLLETVGLHSPPFLINTIIEIMFNNDSTPSTVMSNLSCVGKIVRITEARQATKFGVHLISNDELFFDSLSEFLKEKHRMNKFVFYT